MNRQSIMDRFMSKVEKTDTCWNWTAFIHKNGYGRLSFNKKQMAAHRVSFILHKGQINDGLFVLHTCDNRKCINPDHLLLGTQKENLIDMAKKGRQGIQKIDGHDAYLIRNAIKDGFSNKMIAFYFDVVPDTIKGIRYNRSHKYT